jgi:hypothetical protein
MKDIKFAQMVKFLSSNSQFKYLAPLHFLNCGPDVVSNMYIMLTFLHWLYNVHCSCTTFMYNKIIKVVLKV